MEKLSISDLNIVLVEPSDTQRKIISTFLTKENVKQIDSAANIT
ncbi:MAG: two-component system response regulator, partial [Aestuariibacter sp.]|nr:two-component system response regulator [Aestuariibacter sp.]